MIRYGYQKIAAINTGFCNKSIQHFMQKYGWKRRVKVKKRKRTGQQEYVAPNLMSRDFTASKSFEKLRHE